MKKNLNSININKDFYFIKNNLFKDFNKLSNSNKSKRFRLNLHKNNNSLLHEMIIHFQRESFVSVHYFLNKSTTYIVLKGKIKVNIYNKEKIKIKTITLSDLNTKYSFITYLKRRTIYNIEILTKNALVLELQDNTFNKKDYIVI